MRSSVRLPRGAEAARLPSMATFDSDGPAWTATERTRRTVALNPPEALQDILQLVASILSKILDNPSDPKYRSLKQSGRVCQQRLLGRPGGREPRLAARRRDEDDSSVKRPKWARVT